MIDLKEMITGKKSLVGVDIGSSSLKLAQVVTNSKGHYLNKFVELPLPKGVIIDGVIADSAVLSSKIKELFKNAKCASRGVITAIAGNSVIIKKITLEQMSEAELHDLIRDEAGKYLPFENMDEVSYDFQILGENSYNPNQMDVIVVAAKKEMVNAYRDAVAAAGLSIEIMDVAPFVLETLYEVNYEYDDEDVVILINIGASATCINVVKGGMSVFTRDFAMAGNFITEALQQKKGITFEEAEKIKREGLVNGSENENQDLKNMILELAQPICLEIERSIDYFRSTFGGEDIKQVLLAGGSARIPNLAKHLEHMINIKTEMINPFLKINYNKKNIDVKNLENIKPVAAPAIGLGLRKIGDKK